MLPWNKSDNNYEKEGVKVTYRQRDSLISDKMRIVIFYLSMSPEIFPGQTTSSYLAAESDRVNSIDFSFSEFK